MNDQRKTKAQLISELDEVRKQISDLQAMNGEHEAQQGSEDRYRSSLDNLLEGCQILDFDLRYLYMNDTAVIHGRVPREEKLGRTITEVYPGVESSEMYVTLQRCLEERTSHRMENEFTYPDGRTGWFSLRIVPIPEGIFLLSVDLTERLKVEEALQLREEQYRQLIESTEDWAWAIDLDGNHTFSNEAIYQLLGYTIEEIIGSSPFPLMHPDDRDHVLELLKRSIAQKTGWKDIVIRWMHKDGSRRFFESSAQPVYNADGELTGFNGIDRDITQRVEIELEMNRLDEELQDAELRYRSLYENAPVGIGLTTVEGETIDGNTKLLNMLGYSLEEWQQTTVADGYANIEDRTRMLQQLQEQGSVQGFEVDLKRKDGHIIHVRVTATSLTLSERDILMFTLEDISEKKKAEMERVRAEEALRQSEEKFSGFMASATDIFVLFDQELKYTYINDAGMKVFPSGTRREDMLGKTMLEINPGVEKTDRYGQYLKVIETGEPFTATGVIPYPQHWDVRMIIKTFRVGTGLGMISTDITEQVQVAEALREQQNFAEALVETAVLLNSTLDLAEVLDHILASIDKILPNDTANVVILNDQLEIVRVVGSAKEGISVREEHPESITRYPSFMKAVESKLPYVVPNVEEVDDWLEIKGTEWIKSLAVAPIIHEDRVIGLLSLSSATPDFFDQNQTDHMQVFANQASVAIRNAQAFEKAHELATLEERQRLARDIHDAVSQTLFSANTISEALPILWESDPDEALQGLFDLKRLTRGALAEMRILLSELYPDAIIKTDLSILISQLADGILGRTDIEVAVDVQGQHIQPSNVQTAFFRIAQEVLNNVIKHSEAENLVVELVNTPTQVHLQIIDDGRGFDLKEASSKGFGLSNMFDRASAIGAELKIDTEPGKTTEVNLYWFKD